MFSSMHKQLLFFIYFSLYGVSFIYNLNSEFSTSIFSCTLSVYFIALFDI